MESPGSKADQSLIDDKTKQIYGGTDSKGKMSSSKPEAKSKKRGVVSKKSYNTKKTNVHNLSNLTLLTSNITQLRTTLSRGKNEVEYFNLLITLLSISIGMEVIITVLLLAVGHKESHKEDKDDNEEGGGGGGGKKKPGTSAHEHVANDMSNVVAIFSFILIVINVGITAFSDASNNNAAASKKV
ncbi:ninjurin-2-like [Tubulanus polymorphus]|uniref:ninjurin-2-like n=1 Tax=Tubulanus polymorphus TaxID=672921 RepID=UPI003DA513C0